MPPDVLVTRPKRARRLGLLLAGASVALGLGHPGTRGTHGDPGGLPDGVPIRPGADGREGHRGEPSPVLAGEPQRVLIAAAQQLRLAALAAAPDGPHGVDHVARGEPVGAGHPLLPSRATTYPAALLQQLGARRAAN